MLALSVSARAWPLPSRAAGAAIDLLPWQLAPAMAFFAGHSRRLLLADGVGLGKTIEAGLIVNEVLTRRPWAHVLILTPAGLRAQWCQELASRFGRNAVVADLGWVTQGAQTLPADVNPWTTVPLLVCSWDFAKRGEVLPGPDQQPWDVVVVDEAHALGVGTERATLADTVARRAGGVLLLTATPPDEDPARMQALMALGARPGEASPLVFRRTRAAAAPLVPPRRWKVLRVRPGAEHLHLQDLLDQYTARVERELTGTQEMAVRLALHVMRKRAASSAWALATTAGRRRELLTDASAEPAQLALPLPLDLELELTDAVPDDWLRAPGFGNRRAELAWLARLTDAARTAARSERKLTRLRRLVLRADEPVLAFTEYRDTLLHFAGQLRDLRDVDVLHGALGPSERQQVIERFTRGRTRLLLSTDVASDGLNLHQRCRLVVMLDLPWRAGRLEQRIGRLERLGQRRRVHALALVSDCRLERELLARLRPASRAIDLPGPAPYEADAHLASQSLRAQREALRSLERGSRGHTGQGAQPLLTTVLDRAQGMVDGRRPLVGLLPRRRHRGQWSGMVAIVEGCLTTPDATLVDRAALALHIPVPVPRFRTRAEAVRFVERHLHGLAAHLVASSRTHVTSRWQASAEQWRRFNQVTARSAVDPGRDRREGERPRQPSLFGLYDQRPGARVPVVTRGHTVRNQQCGTATDENTPALEERFSLVLVLVRQGPGTANDLTHCTGSTVS